MSSKNRCDLTQEEMAKLAKRRSPNYEEMSPREQWEEDRLLGILDWDGKTHEETASRDKTLPR